MPTYRNDGAGNVTWEGVSWEPGESRALDYYVPHAPLGLTLVSAAPAAAGQILTSRVVTLVPGVAQTVDIAPPVRGKRMHLSIIARSGHVEATLGGSAAAVLLAAGEHYTSPPEGIYWRHAAQISLLSPSGAEVALLAEEVV